MHEEVHESLFPRMSCRKVKNLRNNLKKSLKRSCRETMRRLKESNGQLTDYPFSNNTPLVEYELVDIFFRMMPYKWREDFHKANESLHKHALDSLCDYME